MTTERTLKKWRREALEVLEYKDDPANPALVPFATYILHMTRELLDIHLLQKRS